VLSPSSENNSLMQRFRTLPKVNCVLEYFLWLREQTISSVNAIHSKEKNIQTNVLNGLPVVIDFSGCWLKAEVDNCWCCTV